MNAFYEHHKDSIEFGYRCFDRLLLNGSIQPFQEPKRVLGFFNYYREGKRVTRKALTEIADQFQYWVTNRSQKWGAPILEAPEDERRDDFVVPDFQKAETDRGAVVLKAAGPARLLDANGDKENESPHQALKQRRGHQEQFHLK